MAINARCGPRFGYHGCRIDQRRNMLDRNGKEGFIAAR
jgi:hypothetical protein